MVFSDWQQAVNSLIDRMQSVTAEQQAIAERAGLSFDEALPKIVAAAKLRVHLCIPLGLPSASDVDDYHSTRIRDLQGGTGVRCHAANLEEAQAWLQYLRFARRKEALLRLKIAAGDVVQLADGSTAIVSSVSEEGRVYLRGGRGRASWPDLITRIEARSADSSAAALRHRARAHNEAALLTKASRWSSVRSDDLKSFAVERPVTQDAIDELESVITRSKTERPIQAYLEAQPQLLTALLGGNERFCMSQKRLGSEFVPDFVIGDVDSLGVRWIVVELETPNSGVFLSDRSTLDKYARKGSEQILDWRNWLSENIAYARRSVRENGLGLYDITPKPLAYVFVGRRNRMPRDRKESKRNALREQQIEVHSYDWLVERLRGATQFQGPPASNPYLIHKEHSENQW